MNSEEIRDALNSMENSSVSGEDFSPDEDEYIPDSGSDTRSDDSIDEDLDVSATNDEEQTETTTAWTSPATGETLKNFEEFTNPPQVLQYDAGTPFQYYRKFLTDEILDIIVEETNRNANSQVTGIGTRSSSRMNMWKDTDRQEIMEFLAIVMYMGMVKYPAITDYWKPSTLFKNAFVPQVMARNRFQILLKFIHFADNAQSSETVSKTYKMQISDFRQSIILFMSGKDSASIARSPPQGKHFLITSTEATKDGRRKRHRCGMCYSELKTTNSSSVARKKAKLVATYCAQCRRSPYLCLKHFQQLH